MKRYHEGGLENKYVAFFDVSMCSSESTQFCGDDTAEQVAFISYKLRIGILRSLSGVPHAAALHKVEVCRQPVAKSGFQYARVPSDRYPFLR